MRVVYLFRIGESSWSNKCAQLDLFLFSFFEEKERKKRYALLFLTSIKRNVELDIVYEHEQVLHSIGFRISCVRSLLWVSNEALELLV